jgi:hypothetical protein
MGKTVGRQWVLVLVAAVVCPGAVGGASATDTSRPSAIRQLEILSGQEIQTGKKKVDPQLIHSFCLAKMRVRADQEAIRALDFKAEIASFEMFEQVSQQQKTELINTLLSAALDQGLEVSKKLPKKLMALNINNVHSEIKRLEVLGLNKNQNVVNTLYELAQSIDERKKIKAYYRFLEQVQTAKKVYSAGAGVVKDPDNTGLRFLLGALQIAQQNKVLDLWVTAAEVGENFAYYLYLSGQVDDLTTLTEQKMKRLHELTTRMKNDMAAFKATQRKLQAAGMSGEPDCP